MAPASTPSEQEGLAFGDFKLFPSQRRLLRAGAAVRVGSRSLDILIALVDRRGEILSKDDLIALVWPNAIVEEGALRVHISTLRKAIGDGEGDARLIANVPGRGYSFVAPVAILGASVSPTALSPLSVPVPPLARLPTTLGRIIGRDDLIAQLTETMREQRLVTLVGPGGMGKTTVALAVAQRLGAQDREVTFVDLAPLADSGLVPGAAASALGLAVRSADLVQDIVQAVSSRRLVLVLDSCDHVIDAAAALAEDLLRLAPGISILATSREALRADGEWVHRLAPLAAPPETPSLSAAEALAYPAVQLFVARAAAVLGGFRLQDSQAALVGEICRRLDGVALALELATRRLDSLSLDSLAVSLENCFEVLTRGRPTALPRHQTLRATIEWSFGFLPPDEQVLLAGLSVFNGPFTLGAVAQVAAAGWERKAVENGVLNLFAKSLLTADIEEGEPRYRLFDTTRAFAREKLNGSDSAAAQRRHAIYYRDLFAAAEPDWTSRAPAGLVESTGLLGNLRAALDWAFSADGDSRIGVALTADAVPLWFQLSLVDECLGRLQSALACLEAFSDPDPRVRMRLHAGLGFPRMRAITGFPSGAEAWRSVLEIASEIGDADYQGRALWALWTYRVNSGEAREALALADRFAALARSAPETADPLIAQRLRAWSLLTLGELGPAYRNVTAMLQAYGPTPRRADVARFQYDQRSTARITLARALWLRGDADQALRAVADNLAEVTAADHTLSLAHVLSDAACFVALWRGELELAEGYVALLRKHTGLQALDVWRTYGDCFQGEILVRRGETAAGIALLRHGMAQLQIAGFVCYHAAFSGVLAHSLAADGRAAEALAIVEAVLDESARTGEAWVRPELLRIRAEVLCRLGRSAEAATNFREALDVAAAQGALAWELRAATSWAKAEFGARAATDRLASVIGRFQEGFDTADLRAADAVLAATR